MNRSLELALTVVAAAILSPIILVVALVVAVGLGRPVLYTQQRTGLGGAPFRLVKFRTMTDDRDPDGVLLPDHERLPAVGEVLRSLSLDELPSLLNVLRGEMSLVGPRPFIHDYWPLYTDHQRRRFETRPGITGLAQVEGRNALDWEDRFAIDIEYVDNRSTWLDLRIILRTILSVLTRRGISSHGSITSDRFTGTTAEPSSELTETA